MKQQRRIYLLDGLPDETIAVCFARCSRTSEDFATIAEQLNKDFSRRFHERWVIGYGHSSVAEHAVVHVAIENVSQLVVENLQSNRLASYTEKSSRYQVFAKNRYYIPKKIRQDKQLTEIYQEAVDQLLDLYHRSLDPIKEQVKLMIPRNKNETEKKYAARIYSKYIDVARMLLPVCMLTNLGMTANARSFEYAITKLLSSPFLEAQEIGQEMKKVVLGACPTLVKYARENKYSAEINRLDFAKETKRILGKKRLSQRAVRVVWHDRFGQERFLAAMLYRFGQGDLNTLFRRVKKWSANKKKKMIEQILSSVGEHDKPPRELEHVYLTFDCLLDQGAYYDLKRNRMMTQTTQVLGIGYGYIIPRIWVKAGLKNDYCRAIEKVEKAYQLIASKYLSEASYLFTKAHKRRFLMTMNLRELYCFAHLRTSTRGHASYRRIAMKCLEEARKIYPGLLHFVHLDHNQSSAEIEKDFFYKV